MATINGNASANLIGPWAGPGLQSTAKADTLNGFDANDSIFGDGGNDVIDGGAGDDLLRGNLGNDTFVVKWDEAIFDTIDGGDGTDTIRNGLAGNDVYITTYFLFSSIEAWNGGNGGIAGVPTDLLDEEGNVEETVGVVFDFSGVKFSSFVAAYDGKKGGIRGTDFDDALTASSLTGGIGYYGFGGDDELVGGNLSDKLYGGDGDDEISGGGGDDLLEGGAGVDEIDGGAGKDTFLVRGNEAAFDDMFGGDDPELGLYATDTVKNTDATKDVVIATFVRGNGIEAWVGGNAGILGTTDPDYPEFGGYLDFRAVAFSGLLTKFNAAKGIGGIRGNDLADTIAASDLTAGIEYRGEGGDDLLIGGAKNDSMLGGAGDDLLGAYLDETGELSSPNAGNDTLYGDAGVDSLYGGDGDDLLDGGDDNDVLDGFAGKDTVRGGSGDDTGIIYASEAAGDSYDGGTNTAGEGGGDLLQLFIAAEDLENGALTAEIAAYAARLAAGEGNLSFKFAQLANSTFVNWERLEIVISDTGTVLPSAASLTGINQAWIGFDGDDDFFASYGDSFGGNDLIDGGAGNDSLMGGSGNDALLGAAGEDRLFGNAGADVLDGGAGDDLFVYGDKLHSTPDQADTIFGFEGAGAAAGDAFDLTGIDAVDGGANDDFIFIGAGEAAALPFTAAGQLRVVQSGADALVQGNTDGNFATIEFQIVIAGATAAAFTADDFLGL